MEAMAFGTPAKKVHAVRRASRTAMAGVLAQRRARTFPTGSNPARQVQKADVAR
jgi:hypothetical protein